MDGLFLPRWPQSAMMCAEKGGEVLTARKRNGIFFCLYCLAMLALLFWRQPPQGPGSYWEKALGLLNPVPFETICRYIGLLGHSNPNLVRNAVINLVGNVILFVPIGVFLPRVFPKTGRWWKVLLITLGAITLIELTQMLTLLGTCDVDDVTLNVLGAMVGYLLFRKR